jgi:hypothetical protein
MYGFSVLVSVVGVRKRFLEIDQELYNACGRALTILLPKILGWSTHI